MTIQEVKQIVSDDKMKREFFKYVQMKGGEYRFAPVQIFGENHYEIANNESVMSAGFIDIRPGYFEISGYSITLDIGPANEDYERLSKLFL